MASIHKRLPVTSGGGGGSTDLTPLTNRVVALEDTYVRSTRFEEIGAGTSGSATLPTNSLVVIDDFGGTVDAIVSGVSNGRPNFEPVYSSAGSLVAATFDPNGAYALSDTPSAYPVAIIYRVRTKFKNFVSTDADIVGEYHIDDKLFALNIEAQVPYAYTHTLMQYATFPFTIVKAFHKMKGGTATVSVKINTLTVGGLGAMSMSTTPGNAEASSANEVVIGDSVNLDITAQSGGQGLCVTLLCARR